MRDPWCYRIGAQVGNAKQVMPPGYSLWFVDDHYMWVEDSTERESGADWNRWRVRRSAWTDYEERRAL